MMMLKIIPSLVFENQCSDQNRDNYSRSPRNYTKYTFLNHIKSIGFVTS
jgi:hypothetical protein